MSRLKVTGNCLTPADIHFFKDFLMVNVLFLVDCLKVNLSGY